MSRNALLAVPILIRFADTLTPSPIIPTYRIKGNPHCCTPPPGLRDLPAADKHLTPPARTAAHAVEDLLKTSIMSSDSSNFSASSIRRRGDSSSRARVAAALSPSWLQLTFLLLLSLVWPANGQEAAAAAPNAAKLRSQADVAFATG